MPSKRRGPRSAAVPPSDPSRRREEILSSAQAGFVRGFGAVVAYSAGVSHLLLSASAPANLSIVLHRPFLEAQLAVAVDVELGERLAPRLDQLGQADPPVLVLVGAGEALLLACSWGRPRARPGSATRSSAPESRRFAAAERTESDRLLGAALPREESTGDEQQKGRDAGEKRAISPSYEGRSGAQHGYCRRRTDSIRLRNDPEQAVRQQRGGAARRRFRLERRCRLASRAASRGKQPSSGRSRRGNAVAVPARRDRIGRPMRRRQLRGARCPSGQEPPAASSSSVHRAKQPRRRSRTAAASPRSAIALHDRAPRRSNVAQPSSSSASSAPADPARQTARRHRLQPRLGRWRTGVEPLERLAPPGEPDRAQRRLGRGRDNLGQRIIDRRTAHRRRAGARPASRAGRDRGPRQRRSAIADRLGRLDDVTRP